MKQAKKQLLTALTLLMLVMFNVTAEGQAESSSGTGSSQNQSETTSADQDTEYRGTITIGVFGDLEMALIPVFSSAEFREAFPGIEVEMRPADFGGHHNRLVTQIAAGTGAYDIEALEIGYLKRFAAMGGLLNLNQRPYFGTDASIQLAHYATGNSTTENGQLLALPISVSPAVLYYRKSLTDAAGVDMNSIATWDEYIEIGRKLTQDLDGDGTIDQYALTTSLDLAMTPLHGGNGSWFGDGGVYAPRSKFLEALTLVSKIENSGISARYMPWSGEWMNSFKYGTVVTAVSGDWLGGHLENWMAYDLAGDWRIAPLPQNTWSSYGGNYLAVPEQTADQKKLICYKIIEYLCTNPNAQASMLETINAFPALLSLYDQPIMDKQFAYFGGQQIRKIFAETVVNIPVQFLSEKDQMASETYNDALDLILRHNASPADALDYAITEMSR